MAVLHQSDLSSFDRCAHAYSLQRAGNRGTQTSALAYGTVIHYAILNVFEREYRTGTPWQTALQMAIDSFKYYWSPMHIEELTEPVELWLPRQTFGGLLAKGQESIRWYAQAAREEESQVIATEIGFQVPIKGTWDDHLGEPHVLAGTIDILKVKPVKRTLTLSIDDLKSGKDYSYLRQNLQFSAYTYATTQKEFWLGWRGEDGFGPQGEELYHRFLKAPRRASWISLKSNKVMDAGWRGPDDWTRFALGVEQFMASVNADIFPLSLNGENCSYCSFRDICAGVGVPAYDHGAP